MKIILNEFQGRWFGVIKDSDDGHGNEIDCYLDTPQQALECLLNQLTSQDKETKRVDMEKTAVCKVCQRTFVDENGAVSDGLHPPRLHYLNEELLDHVVFVECFCCGSKVRMGSVKEESHNWSYLPSIGATFCPGCTHDLTGLPGGISR